MLRFLADQNFDGRIIKGLRARIPEVDLKTAREERVHTLADPELLRWTAEQDRVLLTHDKKTISDFVRELVTGGMDLPGVILIDMNAPLGKAIDDLEVAVGCGQSEDFRNTVYWLPFAS